MMKKLGFIFLIIAFLLSTLSLLPVKKAYCNRPDIALCAAEPWDWLSHSGRGGSGSSGGDNQAISAPANHSVTKHSLNNSTQTAGYQREHSMKERLLNWRLRLLLF